MAKYRYRRNVNESDGTTSILVDGKFYSVGDDIPLSDSQAEQLKERFELEDLEEFTVDEITPAVEEDEAIFDKPKVAKSRRFLNFNH